MISRPTNAMSGNRQQGRDFLYLLEQVRKLVTRMGLNDRAIENISSQLSGFESSFVTGDLEAMGGVLDHLLASRLSLKRNLIQRISAPGDYVVATIGDSSFSGTYGPVPVAGVLKTTEDTQIAFEGTAVPVSGAVQPTIPVSETVGGPAITWLTCNVANKDFEILVLWTSGTCIALWSQNPILPVTRLATIARTTGNAPGDPARLVMRVNPLALGDGFEIQLYHHSINAIGNVAPYLEPINESADSFARLERSSGFANSEFVFTNMDLVNLDVSNAARIQNLAVGGTATVPTPIAGDSSDHVANTRFVDDLVGHVGTTLTGVLDAERAARISGDDRLRADIEAANTARANGDAALARQISGVNSGLSQRIDDEARARANADNAIVNNLNGQIGGLSQRIEDIVIAGVSRDFISEDDDNNLTLGDDGLLFVPDVDLNPLRDELKEAIDTEADDRQAQIEELNGEIIATNKVLSGTHTVTYNGVFQGNIGDMEILDGDLIPGQTSIIAPGKAVFFDIEGSVATYIGDLGIVNELSEIWVVIKSKALNDTILEVLDTKIEGQNIAKYVSTTETMYNTLKDSGQLEKYTIYQYESVTEPTATLIGRWTTPFNQVINNWDGSVIQTNVPFVDATELNFIISAMQGSASGTNGPNNTIEPVIIDLDGAVVFRIMSSPPSSPGTLKALARVRSQVSHEGGQKAVFVNSVADQIVGSAHYWIDENANRITGFNNWSNDPMIYGGISDRPSILPGGAELLWGFAQSADANGPPDGTFNYLLKIERMEMTESL